jgi:hypothetical protein
MRFNHSTQLHPQVIPSNLPPTQKHEVRRPTPVLGHQFRCWSKESKDDAMTLLVRVFDHKDRPTVGNLGLCLPLPTVNYCWIKKKNTMKKSTTKKEIRKLIRFQRQRGKIAKEFWRDRKMRWHLAQIRCTKKCNTFRWEKNQVAKNAKTGSKMRFCHAGFDVSSISLACTSRLALASECSLKISLCKFVTHAARHTQIHLPLHTFFSKRVLKGASLPHLHMWFPPRLMMDTCRSPLVERRNLTHNDRERQLSIFRKENPDSWNQSF